MRRHVSAEVLALYREGAVSARKAAGIASHLSGCPQCEGIDGDLANVSVVLAATSAPPMPDVLAVRIETAIARESAVRAAASPAQVTSTARELIPGRPDLPERGGRGARRFRMPSWSSPLLLRSLAATGAVAVIAGPASCSRTGRPARRTQTAAPAAAVGQRQPHPARPPGTPMRPSQRRARFLLLSATASTERLSRPAP